MISPSQVHALLKFLQEDVIPLPAHLPIEADSTALTSHSESDCTQGPFQEYNLDLSFNSFQKLGYDKP